MKEYLYQLRPTRLEMLIENTAEESAVVGRHFMRLQACANEGIVLLAGRTLNTDASTFGIVIFRAESDEAARQFMNDDPAIVHGVMRGELYPYRVALLSDVYPRE